MPPPSPSNHPSFQLQLLDNPFYVKQLQPNELIVPALLQSLQDGISGRFISITRTGEEISIVGEVSETDETVEATWRCIKIRGPMDFGVTGVMCNFTAPLKVAQIPVFAVSTWNTDYILVPRERAGQAVEALINDGWSFTSDEK